MAIKHLAGKAETCDQALKLFSTFILCNLKNCVYMRTHAVYKSQYINLKNGFMIKFNVL